MINIRLSSAALAALIFATLFEKGTIVMSNSKKFALLTLCSLAVPAAVEYAWAQDPCNGKTPMVGNCGEEDPCDDRTSESECTGTYSRYYEVMGGIECTDGTSDSFCEQDTKARMECTCEFYCTWEAIAMMCSQGAPHNDSSGNQICSKQKEYISKQCVVGS